MIGGQAVKSSRTVKPGDIIELRQPPIVRKFKVKQTAGNRMGAKLVVDFLEDITSPDQLQILETARLAMSLNRAKGLGRPTKKDRRDLDDLMDPDFDWDDEDDNL